MGSQVVVVPVVAKIRGPFRLVQIGLILFIKVLPLCSFVRGSCTDGTAPELDAQATVSALQDVIQRQLNAGQLQQRTRKTTGPMCTRSHLNGERMKGVGGFRQRLSAPPVAGHRPALSAHCTTGTLSFSIATRRDRAAAPKAASTFGRGAPSENN